MGVNSQRVLRVVDRLANSDSRFSDRKEINLGQIFQNIYHSNCYVLIDNYNRDDFIGTIRPILIRSYVSGVRVVTYKNKIY